MGDVTRLLVFAVIAMSVAGCGGASATYSTEEVVDAFNRHDYPLIEWKNPASTAAAREGDLLVTTGNQPFFWVAVATDDAAENAWSDYESQQSQDSFTARRGNVVMSSDTGLDASARERILAALFSLPNRGDSVVIAGQ
jgi:hypothetical protein